MKSRPIALVLAAMFVCFATITYAQQPQLQYFRGWDKDGINVFEPSKTAEQPEYTGFKIRIGGAFTQDFQSITHENKVTGNSSLTRLYGYQKADDSDTLTSEATLTGFNLAMANLNLDFQIADGIRVGLENYMSSRHHSEFWVKGGYIQIDKLPMFGSPDWYTKYFRVKIGHFQPNYGDMQFRRTDGGNAMFNPFVENYILDAFTTEIGGEVYVFPVDGFMGMVGMTSGFINGNVENYADGNNQFGFAPTKKTPSIFAKLAYDKTFNSDFRFRLSASLYNNSNIQRNTLFAGDRTGSHYFLAMEPAMQNATTATTAAAQFTSGRFNPNMSNRITAIMINPFIKFKGLELFGAYETLSGGVYGDTLQDAQRVASWEKRSFNQLSVEGVYRFFPEEQAFIGARYTSVSGQPGLKASNGSFLRNDAGDDFVTVSVNRLSLSAGWFPTKNMLLKGEYVIQNYGDPGSDDFQTDKDFPSGDYRHKGKFSGFMIQAVIGF